MNNEERILEMLTTIQTDINTRFNKLESKVDKLEEGQTAIVKEVKEIHEQTEYLTEVSAEIRLNLNEISGVTKVNSFDIVKLRAASNL